ncbi:hypothetical protein Ddye_001052 [Dipteronia dyeriana]|uniref:Protein FAR1-RELATED SEQUENCE n=1 Tax=Dipteronia dyeriana TaxID=168575 RepID=A0AAD9XNG0_9ROSI|nr:hypothetical protein Ddye_001052 [Dipteronia dyeriana]
MCNTKSKRRPQLQTRVGCKARFSVSLDRDTNKYIIRAFEENHCHKIVTFREVSWVRSHRNIEAKDLSQSDAMGNCCISPCLTYEYMVNQKRGYSKIGFTRKDMYNQIDAKRRDEAFESDSQAALMYLLSKANCETNFYCRFSIDEKDRLANIFWRDSHSLFEYQCFRDVLVFDNTYKTNAYAKPLVLFVGVNTMIVYLKLHCCRMRLCSPTDGSLILSWIPRATNILFLYRPTEMKQCDKPSTRYFPTHNTGYMDDMYSRMHLLTFTTISILIV